jgi:hypothetical protein
MTHPDPLDNIPALSDQEIQEWIVQKVMKITGPLYGGSDIRELNSLIADWWREEIAAAIERDGEAHIEILKRRLGKRLKALVEERSDFDNEGPECSERFYDLLFLAVSASLQDEDFNDELSDQYTEAWIRRDDGSLWRIYRAKAAQERKV